MGLEKSACVNRPQKLLDPGLRSNQKLRSGPAPKKCPAEKTLGEGTTDIPTANLCSINLNIRALLRKSVPVVCLSCELRRKLYDSQSQLNHCTRRPQMLIRVYLRRDHETKIDGGIKEAQAYLTGKLRERSLGRDLEGDKRAQESGTQWIDNAIALTPK
jgi:hypothetical protein